VSLGFSLLERAEGGAEFVVVSVRDSTKEQQLAEELNRTQSESESLLAELDEAYQRLKKAQDDLVRRERLAVSSEMAASVAHEIRNPLAIIMMSIQYLHSKLSPGHALREFTSVIVNKVKQLDEITTQLIDYGRPRELKFEARDLHQNLNQVLCLANSKCLAQRIKVIKRYHRGSSKVTCDHGLMDEVFSNLLMNAIQSMPKGGVLTVETQYDQRNNQATIRITDTGCGIPKNIQPQLPSLSSPPSAQARAGPRHFPAHYRPPSGKPHLYQRDPGAETRHHLHDQNSHHAAPEKQIVRMNPP